MSLGRKKTEQTIKVDYPKPVTRTTYTNPFGDRFISTSANGKETYNSKLSSKTQFIVNESLSGLQSLAQELNAPDARRMQQIIDESQGYYDLQADGINEDLDNVLARTKTDLNKRFGGAYNATFGTSMLSGIEGTRIDKLSDARKQAVLLGEDLAQQDEDSRIQRFNLFQSYLNDLSNQARGFQTNSSTVFSTDRQRVGTAALQSQELANNYSLQSDQNAQRARQAAIMLAIQATQ